MPFVGALAWLAVTVVVRGQPTEGLVAYYPFSGNAQDQGPNGLHGTVHGATLAPNRTGQPDLAYAFNGRGDYIDLGNSALLRPTNEVTLSLWASADWANLTSPGALAGNTHTGGYQLYLNTSAGVVEGRARRGGAYRTATHRLTSLAPGWHHLAVVCDSTATSLYVDGTLMAAVTQSGPIQYSYANNFLVGGEAGSGALPEGDYFAGAIDEVRVYHRALSRTEIAALSEIPAVLPNIATEGAVLLSWAIVPGNYDVESAPSTGGPWTRVAGTLLQVDGRMQFAAAAREHQQYFRLVRVE
jgi:hypothetical protein